MRSSEHPQLTEEIVGPQLPAGDHQNADFASPVVAKVRSILEQSAELGAAAGLLSSFSEQQQQQLSVSERVSECLGNSGRCLQLSLTPAESTSCRQGGGA